MVRLRRPRAAARADRWRALAGIVALALAAVPPLVVAGLAGRAGGATPAGFEVFVTAAPVGGTVPLTESFDAIVSNGTPTAYAWTFGDGTGLNGSDPSDATPVHVYTLAGTYTVSVTVSEGTTSGSASLHFSAVGGPLTAHIVPTPSDGAAPLTVLFHANVSGGTGTYVDFSWNFGNGGTGLGPEAAITYATPGTYQVTLTVNDSGGSTDRVSLLFTVASPGTGTWFPTPLELGGAAVAVAAVGVAVWFRRRGRPPGSSSGEVVTSAAIPSAPPDTSAASPGDPPPPVGPEPPGSAWAPVGTELASPATAEPPTERPDLVERRRLSHRLVVRLAELGRLAPDDTPDARWTQQGLGEYLEAPQNRVSNVLRRLEVVGVLEAETRHVSGRPRRVKVYRLTGRGESLARSYRREWEESGASGTPGPEPRARR